MFQFKGKEFDVDVTDLDFIEKYEKGYEVFTRNFDNAMKKNKLSDNFKAKIKAFNDFLLIFLTQEEIDSFIENKKSLKDYMTLFTDFLTTISKTFSDVESENMAKFKKLDKYSIK